VRVRPGGLTQEARPTTRLGRDSGEVAVIVSPEVSGHRLDDEKLDTLRSWGAGLSADGRDELRAAGKAILILVEEIDRLQVDLWRRRDGDPAVTSHPPPPVEGTIENAAQGFLSAGEPDALDSTLRGRVGRLLGARPVKRD
jgi:hypothetical protein